MKPAQSRTEPRVVLSLWVDVVSGRRLGRCELRASQERAHRAYEANLHVFEDESDALRALGVMPILEAIRLDLVDGDVNASAA